MSFLSREQVLVAQGRRYRVVELPNVGPVRIGSPSAAVTNAIKGIAGRLVEGADLQLEMMEKALLCIVDGEGKRIFDAETARRVLDEWSSEDLTALTLEVSRLAAEGQEALEKKLGQPGGSGEGPPPNPSGASPTAG